MNPLPPIDVLQHLDRVLTDTRSADEAVFLKPSERALFLRRAELLRELVATRHASELTRADIAAAVFTGLQPDSVRSQFSRFRTLLEKIGSAGALRFALVQDELRNVSDDQIKCRFEGDSMMDARIESVSREAIAAIGSTTIVEQEARPDRLKVFVSFAWVDRELANQFMQELRDTMHTKGGPQIDFWKCDERLGNKSGIEIGSPLEASVRAAMQQHPVGLLLLSKPYFNSKFICDVEIPYYLNDPKKREPAPGRVFPVGLGEYRPGDRPVSCPQIADSLVCFLPRKKGDSADRSYIDLKRRDKDREEFIGLILADLQRMATEPRTVEGDVRGPASRHASLAIPAGGLVTSPTTDCISADLLRVPKMSLEDLENLKDFYPGDAKPEQGLGRGSRRETAPSKESDVSREGAVPLLPALHAWLKSGSETPAYLALLGETGAGKTMTTLELTRQLLADGKSAPLTIYLDLRRANEDGLISRNPRPLLAEIMESVLRRTGGGDHSSVEELLLAVRERGALLIWDGLDEVLVHLSNEAGQAFYRQLLEALPPRLVGRAGAGRLIFACRTQFFRDLNHEADLFSGGQKEGIALGSADRKESEPLAPTKGLAAGSMSEPAAPTPWKLSPRARFEVLRVLPFSEAQIRGYLAANLPGLDVERAMEVISTVHNLRELAERPYLLSLLRESLVDCDDTLASGGVVRAVDLYERMINRWLEREKTREAISRAHKRRLMGLLAHHLWCEGTKSISIARLDEWLEKLVVEDAFFAKAMGTLWSSGSAAQETLCEHLRAATFLGRWDGESFRFAHTSLQEFFLASYLLEALEAGNLDQWELPMPSQETLDFLTEMWEQRHAESPAAARRLETGMVGLLGNSSGLRSQVALAFYLRMSARGNDLPSLSKVDCQGLDLTAWKFHGTAIRPLRLPGADFSGACLIRASFEQVEFTGGSRWCGADLRSAEWIGCGLEHADFTHQGGGASCPSDKNEKVNQPKTQLDGALLRACRLTGSRTEGAETFSRKVRVWLCLGADPVFWPTLFQPTHPFLQIQTGHAREVSSVAFSPDGKEVVSGSNDKTVRVWDAATGSCLRVLSGHENCVRSVAFSPDGTQVVSGAWDKTVRLWDAASGSCLRVLSGHENWVTSVAFSPDGTQVVSGSSDQTVRVWDTASGSCLSRLSGHQNSVTSVAFSPDGTQVVSGANDQTVRLWDAASGSCLHVLLGHEYWVRSVAFSPDGKQVVSVAFDKTVRLWDSASGSCLRALSGDAYWFTSVAFSPDGTQVVSGSVDETVRVWDAASGSCLRVLSGHEYGVNSVAFSPDGTQVVSGSLDRTVRVWDAASGSCLRVISGREYIVASVGFSPDGKLVVSKDFLGKTRCWHTADGAAAAVTSTVEEWLSDVKDGGGTHAAPSGETLEVVGRSLIRLRKDGVLLREILPLPNGESIVLEPWDETEARKPAEACRWKFVSGPADAWRYLNTIDRANGTVHPLEAGL